MDPPTDAASIKPVSSLRAQFEGLKASQQPADDRSAASSPAVLKPSDAGVPTLRASFDLPRPISPWSGGARTPNGGPPTPSKGTESPPRPGHKRPMSMLLQSSPQLTPSVKIESPRSPPRTFFERSSSRSPERVDNTPFAKVRELISQHSSTPSSRSPTPRVPSSERIAPAKPAKADAGVPDPPEPPKSPSRPPPVNRAEKPKIPAKPNSIAVQNVNILHPEVRRPSVDVGRASFDMNRASPFSTPPSSNESSPSRSPEPSKAPLPPRTSSILPPPSRPMPPPSPAPPRTALDQNGGQPKDARFMGFSTKQVVVEKKDPRSLGFASPDPRLPTQQPLVPAAAVPARANTVSEKPTRDPREFGLSAAKPASRHVSESIRHVPPPPVAPLPPPSRTAGPKDARLYGFGGHASPDVEIVDDALNRPGLPPRRAGDPPPRPSNQSKRQEPMPQSSTDVKPQEPPPRPSVDLKRQEPPPRPSNDSKNTSRGVYPFMPHSAIPDRVPRPISSQPISRAPTAPIETRFPPPPKRESVDLLDMHSASVLPRAQTFTGEAVRRPPARVHGSDSDETEAAATPITDDHSTSRTEYPDATRTNRRPPFCKGDIWELPTKSDSRIIEVCGKYLCTTGYVTRVFDMTTGDQIMSINHGDTVKVTAAAFKPAAQQADEGKQLWLGNNIGEILEVDVESHTVVTTSSVHNRREIVRILRHRRDLWTLDDDGKLLVWKADETGVPNLKYSHISHRVQKGHTFSMIIGNKLWLATGKEIRVYKPGNEASFAPLTKPLSQHGNGDITSGAHSDEGGGRAYFGHIDGRVAIYSTQDYSCLANVKASDYKINGLAFVGDHLWAAYKTGKVYVYDTSVSPWRVKKDWRAHNGPATELLVDPSSIWTLERLQAVTIGHDNFVRLWDGMLEDDWIETQMQERDAEYCTFREVRAAVVTWNCGASTPYDLRNDFVADAIHSDNPPEILIFGFQEVVDLEDRAVTAKSILGFGKKKDTSKNEQHQSRVYREWRDYLRKVISRYTSATTSYSELQTSSLIGLFQCVFIKQEERPNVRSLEAASVKLGMKGHYGNKGALVTRFVLDDSSLCFINCHLAAGQTHTAHRNNDVATILEAEPLAPELDLDERSSLFVGGGDGTQILDHEICILNGDLNYRIDAIPRDTVINMVKRGDLAKLLERDQIMVSRRRVSGFRLSAFNELPITFDPTYKYDVGTDNYDTSEKKRAPAWCDRLLYRGQGRVNQLEYRRHEVRTSDHRPVSGMFTIQVKTVSKGKRARVKQDCYAQFGEVKRKLAEKASIAYLVTRLGVDETEAKKLIVHPNR